MFPAARFGLVFCLLALGCASSEEQPKKSTADDEAQSEDDEQSDDDAQEQGDDEADHQGKEGDDDDGAEPVKDAAVRVDAATAPKPDASKPPAVDGGVKPAPDAGGSDASMPSTTPATECKGTATLAPGAQMTVMLNGRQYLLHVGKAVKPGQAAPLLFSLHGLNMTPSSMESMARWFPLSDTEGFIVAGPAGVGSSNGWDLTGTKDFDLMKAVIEDVNSKVCVDRKRIYATGFSHGGFMSFAIGCRLGDIFAAVAPHSGAGSGRSCVSRAVPTYAWHGDADSIVSYSSGKSSVDSVVARNKCTGSPKTFTVSSAQCQHWSECDGQGEVKFCTIPGGSHSWFRNGATAAIWEFFKQHSLP